MLSACCLILLYICVKFCENITKGIRVMERIRVHGRIGYDQCSNYSKSRLIRVTVHLSVHHLIVLYIVVNFHENI